MASLASIVLRHRRSVVLVWAVLLIGGALAASDISRHLSKDFAVPGARSYRANQEIQRLFGTGGSGYPDVAVIRLAGATVHTPGVEARLAVALAAVQRDPRLRVVSYFNTGERGFASVDGRTTFALIFKPFHGELAAEDYAPQITRAIVPHLPLGASVRVTGIDELARGGSSTPGFGVLAETLLAGLGALAVLALVFGSLLALVPLVLATVSILTTFLIIRALTEIATVSLIVQYLVALIGLGVAIDYSLLIVTRWREELAAGHSASHAVARALATAGRAVAISAIIVAVGLLALVLLPVPALRSIGYAGMLVPLISALAALTLLPVILATIGQRADWPHRRTSAANKGWERWARNVVTHPWRASITATLVLALLAAAALQLRIGQPDTASLAQTGPAATTLETLKHAGIPTGALTPIQALTPADSATSTAQRLAHLPGVRLAAAPPGAAWQQGNVKLITIIPTHELATTAGHTTLDRVRATAAQLPATRIGGAGALTIDETHIFYERFALVLALIALTTLALLTYALRSLLLPIKAIVLNLASVAATYGVIVLVWQQGHGSQTIWNTPATGAITNWVPLMAFAFLYGLSMDYEVFILTRIREEYDHTHSTPQAIINGISRTGRLVTSAALILFLAFAALTAAPETDLRIMATALGAGILLDATVVRSLLVPALITLFGRWNWWLPTTHSHPTTLTRNDDTRTPAATRSGE
jgi:RND superfamily putative drug exporter